MQTVTLAATLSTIFGQIEEKSNFTSPIISEVFLHWSEIARAANGIPDRRAISPHRIKAALPHIWLCDHESETARFRYRLAGEHVIANANQPIRGRYLDHITDRLAYSRVRAYFLQCVEHPAILHIVGRLYTEKARVAVGERIMLPYGDGGGAVTGILGATVRQWQDRHVGELGFPADTRLHTLYRLDNGEIETEHSHVP